ncbi:SDR family oxidoreductase [Solimonas sp. K1W22B-7]|uniref:SDR family oxidoreductase n=1 Tax=Solimonas sp. K1W22B-7 TaxID=2303331 RepID=UPI000E3364AC|nr:SDR family oxidoreductase [Solimonas sp. K1W22B-7]AXQ31102.1 SDR family oxidoreductase [Solimonas sp. K1W22B-7]
MKYNSLFRTEAFKGKVVMVTGGGSGIGRCAAHELAALGASVIITGRKQEKLDQVAAEIQEDGGSVRTMICDIREDGQVKDTISQIVSEFGRIHGLFNNAGGQFPSALDSISANGFDAVVRNNLLGTFLMMREVYNQSMRQHGGAIVNMSAIITNGMPGMGHSGAARAGVENLTKTAALEWAKSGVRVNAVAPGWIMSSGMDTYKGDFRAMIPMLASKSPLKRLGTESEISSVACFLLSDAAAYVSGVTVPVDGAATLCSPIYPLADHQNSEPFNGFHRAFIPEVLKESQ